MAVINSGGLSCPSGKIGNVVAAKWKGICYLRAKPEHFTDANTVLQQAARMKLTLTIGFLKACLPVVRIGFSGYSTPSRAAFHAATSYNYHHGITGEFPNLELDFANNKVSRGLLPGADTASCEPVEPGKIGFQWSTNSESMEAGPDDAVLLLGYNPARQSARFCILGTARKTGQAVLDVPSDFSDETVHCYLCFADLTKLSAEASVKCISDSMYLGKVVVL